MPVQPGTRLGPYEIVAPLGAGGMGEVYRARDTRLERDVAVKVLPAEFSADAARLRRFEQEARAAGMLNHPNILIIYDIGTHEGTPYVVSELLEGETLRERLGGAPLPSRKAIEYALQIAHGLAAAHEKGITHRDLKPENLFLTRDGRVKILDFGLAKLGAGGRGSEAGLSAATAEEHLTSPGAVLGTVGYMSPEQARGRPADHRADIFGFGATLYEMLSGQRAFRGDSAVETMSAILKEEPPELNVPAGLERIVRHCLEKNPEERFHSARDLAFALEALSGISAPATAAPALAPALAPAPARRRLLLGLAGLVALAAVGGGFFAGWRIARTPPPSFQRLTFRRGATWSARLAPDGKTIFYSSMWEGRPIEIFSTRPENPESRPLGISGAELLAISSSGEMAISLNRHGVAAGAPQLTGTLARMPLAGGAPREMLEDVDEADWAPDGKSLAVVRRVEGRIRVEFPIGKVLYEVNPPNWLHALRVSPKGDRVAFIERTIGSSGTTVGGSVEVVDLAGKKRRLSTGLPNTWSLWGLAWSPKGDEIWFAAVEAGEAADLLAVTLSGRQRVVARMAGGLVLHDILRDGLLLLDRYSLQFGILGLPPGETKERDLSWLDGSVAADLSTDGKTLLFTETGRGVAPGTAVYLRKTDGSAAVRLGDGRALALSSDGKWALAATASPPQLVLLPTGAGESKPLARGLIDQHLAAGWFPDGKRILFAGSEPGRRARLYAQNLAGGNPQAVSPEGFSAPFAVSPDGKSVAAMNPEGRAALCPLEGGEPRPLPGLTPGDAPIRWSADGRFLYVYGPGGTQLKVYRYDLSAQRKELWKELAPSDPAGVIALGPVLLTPDGKSYTYSYGRYLTDLYLAEGFK